MNTKELLAHSGFIHLLARNLIFDEHLAEDIEQQSYLAALEKPPITRESLRAWFTGVVKNLARIAYRKEKSLKQREERWARSEAIAAPEEIVAREEIRRIITDTVLSLEEPYRATLLLRFYENQSPREIAKSLDLPVETVKTRLKRGLARMRDRLDTAYDGDRRKWFLALAPIAGLKLGASSAVAATSSMAGVTGVSGLILKWKAVLVVLVVLSVALGIKLVLFDTQDRTQEEIVAGSFHEGIGAADSMVSAETGPGSEQSRVSMAPAAGAGRIMVSGSIVDLSDPQVGGDASPAAGLVFYCAVQARSELKGLGYINSPAPPDMDKAPAQVTDAEGRFQFDLEDPGKRPLDLQITIKSDEKFRMLHHYISLQEEQWEARDLCLERIPYGNLHGETKSVDGTPLAGVALRFKPQLSQGAALVLETVISDSEGRFVVPHLQQAGHVEAHLQGYRLIDATRLRRLPKGGWENLQVTMAPTRSLAIKAVDPKGKPVADVKLSIEVSHAEWVARQAIGLGGRWERVEIVTDFAGYAEVENIWAGKKLTLDIQYQKSRWQAERMQDGRAVYHPETAASQAIVVPPDGYLELLLPIPAPIRFHGRVLFPDARPVSRAKIVLAEIPKDLTRIGTGFQRGTVFQSDEEGRFDYLLFEPFISPNVHVIACDESFSIDTQQWVIARNFSHCKIEPLGLHGSRLAEFYLELVLEKAMTIEGVVLHSDGQPVKGWVAALSKPDISNLLSLNGSRVTEYGSFSIKGLPPGAHHLTVNINKQDDHELPVKVYVFRDIEAGSTGNRLIIEPKEPAIISIEAFSKKDNITSLAPVLGRYPHMDHSPHDSGQIPTGSIHAYDGWVNSATLLLGYGSARGLSGERFHYFQEAEGSKFDFPPCTPGWYWIGVRAFDDQGRIFHPTGIGPLYLGSGEHSFRFELDRVADLKGRLVMDQPDTDLCVALVDGSGNAVTTRSNIDFCDTLCSTGADGSFRFRDAPVGKFFLRVGREEELRAGEYGHQVKVELEEGNNPFLTLPIP